MREFLSSLLHNKVALFNITLIAAVIVFLAVANIQQEVNIEDYATVPFDYTPILLEEHDYTGSVELVYDKDTFQIDYRIGRFPIPVEVMTVTITEASREDNRPLPMSPSASVFHILSKGDLSLAIAIKKIAEDPAVYSIKINDRVVAYFSDPFPTGHNSIVIYTVIDGIYAKDTKDTTTDTTTNTAKDTIKIEISKVRTLG